MAAARTTGWKPDRSHPLGATWVRRALRAGLVLAAEVPPSSSDAGEKYAPKPHWNQGAHESCTGYAISAVLRAAAMLDGVGGSIDWSVDRPSPIALWHGGRWLLHDGSERQDVGTYLHLVWQYATSFGFPPESLWRDDDAMLVDKSGNPLPRYACGLGVAASEAAFDFVDKTESAYYRLDESSPDALKLDIQRALSQGRLVSYGMTVTQDFVALQGKHLWTRAELDRGVVAGGHAMFLRSYDENGPRSGNQWGDDDSDPWGDEDGATQLSWDVVCDPNRCQDFGMVKHAVPA